MLRPNPKEGEVIRGASTTARCSIELDDGEALVIYSSRIACFPPDEEFRRSVLGVHYGKTVIVHRANVVS